MENKRKCYGRRNKAELLECFKSILLKAQEYQIKGINYSFTQLCKKAHTSNMPNGIEGDLKKVVINDEFVNWFYSDVYGAYKEGSLKRAVTNEDLFETNKDRGPTLSDFIEAQIDSSNWAKPADAMPPTDFDWVTYRAELLRSFISRADIMHCLDPKEEIDKCLDVINYAIGKLQHS